MNKVTQCDRVLNYLKEHGEITTRQAVTELNILSLPRRIMELRQRGYRIELVYKKSPNGARYGIYCMDRPGDRLHGPYSDYMDGHPAQW